MPIAHPDRLPVNTSVNTKRKPMARNLNPPVTAHIPQADLDALDKLAADRGITRSDLLRTIIGEYLLPARELRDRLDAKEHLIALIRNL